MRKLFIILTALSLILMCGCTTQKAQSDIAPEAIVKMPADDTVNGYRISAPAQSDEVSKESNIGDPKLFYANKNSKTFHLSTCGTAKRIKNENLYITDDRNELLLEGFKPCSNCKP